MSTQASLQALLQRAYAAHQQSDFQQAAALYQQVLQTQPNNPDALVLMGALAYETEKYADSVSYFQRLRELAPERSDFLENLGAALQMTGDPDQAVPVYQQALKASPDSAACHYNLASALKDSGQPELAVTHFLKALELAPGYAKAHNNLAAAYKQLNQFNEARQHFQAATRHQPDYAMAWLNLADLEHQQGQLEQAEHAYQQALQHLPADASLRYKLGTLYQKLGQLEAALSHLQTAVELSPKMAEAWRSLGVTQQALGNFEGSLKSLQTAIEINPNYSEARNNLGNSYRELGQTERAREAYQEALAYEPSDANRLRLATLLPPIYQSEAELLQWREQFASGIKALNEKPLQLKDPLLEVGQTNFYLAYQGGDDKPLQAQIAALYRPLLPEQVTPATPAPSAAAGSKRRVGVLSAFLYNHSITHYYGRHLAKIAADPELELSLLLAPGSLQDQVTEQLRQTAAHCLQLPRNLEQARQQVAELKLDLLIYPDIGLEPFSYFMAFTRLAEVQCVLPGHPVTTGIPTLDYFVSNTYTELPEAADHYSETLVQLESLPVWYKRPQLPASYFSREQLGLKAEAHVFVCPMTLFKVHPEMDAALNTILENDPAAEIYFFRFKQTQLHQLLAQRFKKSLPKHHQRVHFLPWADSQTFFSWLHQADVLLDTFHFGGGSTHFLCLATGTPMLTWPSAYLRGRSGAGLYQRMGIAKPVAHSQQHYAQLALELSADKELNQQLRQQIKEQQALIFENEEGPQSFLNWVHGLF